MQGLDTENRILREVEKELGSEHAVMIAECINKCPTLQKPIYGKYPFYYQECILIVDTPQLVSDFSLVKTANLLGLSRGTLRNHIKNNPKMPVAVYRDDDGEIINLELIKISVGGRGRNEQ